MKAVSKGVDRSAQPKSSTNLPEGHGVPLMNRFCLLIADETTAC